MRIGTSGRTLLVAGVLSLAAAPAFAVTVTNNADKTHEVTVDLGSKESKTKIEAGKSAQLDCPSGCELRVDDSGYGLDIRKDDAKAVVRKDGMLAFADQASGSGGMKAEGSSSSAN